MRFRRHREESAHTMRRFDALQKRQLEIDARLNMLLMQKKILQAILAGGPNDPHSHH